MDSFQTTLEGFEPMIHQIIRSLSIYKNHDEFYQIGLIALWEATIKFNDEKGHFSSYAYATIRGKMLTELTKLRKWEEQNAYPSEDFWELNEDMTAEQPLELVTLLAYCNGLTHIQRNWVIMTFYYGMNTREIAEKEQVSIAAVKKWRTRSMMKLRKNAMMVD